MSGAIDEDEKNIAKTLRLRAASPSVTRVSRRALIICGAVLATGVSAALGWSLVERRKVAPEPAFAPAPPPPEGIANLPRDYIGHPGTPVLGPPLPGDLGRPMLHAEAEGRDVVAGAPPPSRSPYGQVSAAPTATSPSEPARGLFVATAAPTVPPSASVAERAGPVPATDPRVTSVERLQGPASPYILQAGAIIPAALVTGLRSDVPGMAIAQVTQDVFDSLGGGHLLIPQGARMIGEYDAQVASGQDRLGVIWTRLILPSGRSIVLDKLPGADAQGMAGLHDGVDRHGREVLGAAALSTLLAIGSESGSTDESDLVRAVRRGAAQGVTDVGQQAVGRSLARAPSLTIRPGTPLRVLLTRDLVLELYVEDRR
jgi:type IV secretory pathway VirB10-like protein